MTTDDEETPGLADERTDLAWSRSGLAVLACLAAIARRLLLEVSGLRATTLIWAGLAVGALALVIAMIWSRRVASATLAGRQVAGPRTLRYVAYGTTTLGLVALLIALIPTP